MTVTVCPAASAHDLLADEPIFHRPALAVSAHFTAGGECVSTGISFDDYHGMRSMSRGNFKRRKAPPTWSDDQLQEILCVALEVRAGIYEAPKSLSRLQRIEAAHQRLLARRDGLLNALDVLCERFMELRAVGLPTKDVEAQIEMYDAQLLMLPRLPAILCAVVYLSFRLGFTSTQVAHQLRVTPVFVRQVLFRIRVIAGKIERGESLHSSWGRKRKARQ
jgi:hypothetical protein